MLRRLQASLLVATWVVATAASAQGPEPEASEGEPAEDPPTSATAEGAAAEATTAEEPQDEATAEDASAEEPQGEATAEVSTSGDAQAAQADTEPPAAAPTSEDKSVEQRGGWDTFLSGYFRAPMAIGFSPRPSPDDLAGPDHMQISYGPNRTVDSTYYSFAYTRLQEQDWSEIFIHAKKKHVEAVVGWMGYWYQTVGLRNPDASWFPGMAYLTLDTDLGSGDRKPNLALTAGAFWPKFGYHEKYDTYTLGQFRHLGEQLKLTLPFGPDVTMTLQQGFGTSRDGSFIYQPETIPAIYGATTGLDLIHYENVRFKYKEYVDVGLHFNNQWTRDPNLFISTQQGKAFTQALEAHLTTMGGEVKVSVPRAGSLWVSPSYVQVKNGWALAEGGTEVMHSLSGDGLATNYLAWTGSLADSTGTGSLFNLGFLYENTLSGIQGKAPGSVPEVTLNVFGLFADITLDLPEGSSINQDRIGQFKYGADVELQALDWLAFMLRWDEVNYNLDHPGYIFSAITPRVTFSSHFLSGESIYLQYSRYRYGDNMVLAGKWPWGTPLVAGTDIIQGGTYSGHKPDMDVVKLQAAVSF